LRHSLTCSPAFKLVPSLSFLRSSSSAPPEIDRDLLAPTHSARLASAFTPIDVATKLKTFSAFILQKKRGESLKLFHFSPDCLLYILYPTLSTSNYTTDTINIENIKNIDIPCFPIISGERPPRFSSFPHKNEQPKARWRSCRIRAASIYGL
jgi:hypothetical protein